MATTIASLPIEILIIIMSLLGKTCNGAASVAKAMSVSRLFLEAGRNAEDLSKFLFRNTPIEYQHRLFQHRNGLIYNCAQAGNIGAQYLLAKVMLVTCTQLRYNGVPKEKLNKFRNYNPNNNPNSRQKYREKALAASFMSHFNVSEGTKMNTPQSSTSASSVLVLSHTKLVKVFLLKVNTSDISDMSSHLKNYVKYFLGRATYGTDADLFLHFINTLGSIYWKSSGTHMVRYQGHFYVKKSTEEDIYPPQQLQGFNENEEYIDWKYDSIVFAEVRKQALQAFDLLIPHLH